MERTSVIPYIEIGWAVALLLPLIFLRVNRYLNWFITYSWCLALFKTQNPHHRLDYPIHVLLAAENRAYFFMTLIVLIVLMMKVGIPTDRIERFLANIGVFNILLTTILIPFNDPFMSGLVSNKSMNAVFNLMLLPFVMNRFKSYGLGALCLFTVFASESSTALLALILMVCYLFRKNAKLLLVFAGACALVGALSMHGLFDPGFRGEGWFFFFNRFTLTDWLFGRGPGSFFSFSVFDQHSMGFGVSQDFQSGAGLYIWMHSDPLQALYEFGIIGVLTLIPAVLYSFESLSGPATYSLIALVSSSFLYYPFHWSLHLIVAFCLLKIANNNYSIRECQKLDRGC